MIQESIMQYNISQEEKELCDLLANQINASLPKSEHKIWHAHPVWFIDGNPIVGYSKQKNGIRLMFWSGQDFEEDGLNIKGQKFKDASIFYNHIEEINISFLKRCLEKALKIQWDYKNLVKRKGKLEKIEPTL